jgi:class 3 adenylate cyclase/CheY-like chemotaxis protein
MIDDSVVKNNVIQIGGSEARHLSFSRLRVDLRTALDEIIGYVQMMPGGAGEPTSDPLVSGAHELAAIASSLALAVDSSSPHPTGRYLAKFGERLLPLGNRMRRCAGQLLALAAAAPPDVAADLERIAKASRRVTALADELLANPEAFARGDADPAAAPLIAALRDALVAVERPAPVAAETTVLIVDDNEDNRRLLAKRVEREGYSRLLADGGRKALELLEEHRVDLVLLDVLMPDVDGLEVLRQIKSRPAWRDIPVLMISAVDDVAIVARCIEEGADDYLPKPFDPMILRARLRSCIERRQLREMEKQRTTELETLLSQVQEERRTSESLLLNILPRMVADELRGKGSVDPMYFEDVTILFTDVVGFTLSTEAMSAEELVGRMHEYFTAFDNIVARYGLEKLKTIGDSYMCAGGLPERTPSHPVDVVLAAFELVDFARRMQAAEGAHSWPIRVGIHTGPVIAGVVGIHKFAFDIWGETVNFASRMESSGEPNRINVSERTYARVKDFFACETRGKVKAKHRRYEMHFVNGLSPQLLSGDPDAEQAFTRRYRIYFKKAPRSLPETLFKTDHGRSCSHVTI